MYMCFPLLDVNSSTTLVAYPSETEMSFTRETHRGGRILL